MYACTKRAPAPLLRSGLGVYVAFLTVLCRCPLRLRRNLLQVAPMDVRVVPYDPTWVLAFADEAGDIRSALQHEEMEVHHMGSTAIPGMFAKPIIDILLIVPGLELLDAKVASMTALGYEAMGEFGSAGRRYFRKDAPNGLRTHQVHAFEAGSAGARRHLAFRDYMRSHPEAAQEYSILKQRLAIECALSIQDYMDGKDSFVKHHESLALEWLSRGRSDA